MWSLPTCIVYVLLTTWFQMTPAFVSPSNICTANPIEFLSGPNTCQICQCATPFSSRTACNSLIPASSAAVPNTPILGAQCPQPAECAATLDTTWYLGAGCPTCNCEAKSDTVMSELTFSGLKRCMALDCVGDNVPTLTSLCASNATPLPRNITNTSNVDIRVPRYATSYFTPMWLTNDVSGDVTRDQPFLCLGCSYTLIVQAQNQRSIHRPRNTSVFAIPATTSGDPLDTKCNFATCLSTSSNTVDWTYEPIWNNVSGSIAPDFVKYFSGQFDPIGNTTSLEDRNLMLSASVIRHCESLGWSHWNYCKFTPSQWILNPLQCSHPNMPGNIAAKFIYEICPYCSCSRIGDVVYESYNYSSVLNNTQLTEYFCDKCTCQDGSGTGGSNYMTCERVISDYVPVSCGGSVGSTAVRSCVQKNDSVATVCGLGVSDATTCSISQNIHWMDFNLYDENAHVPSIVRACDNDTLCNVLGGTTNSVCVEADIDLKKDLAGVPLTVWNCSNSHISDLDVSMIAPYKAKMYCGNNNIGFPSTCTSSSLLHDLTVAGLRCAYSNINPLNWQQDLLQYILCHDETLYSFNANPCGDHDIFDFLNKYASCYCTSLAAVAKGNPMISSQLNSYFDWKMRSLLDVFRMSGCLASMTCDALGNVIGGTIDTWVLKFDAGFGVNETVLNRTLMKMIIGADLGGKAIEQISLDQKTMVRNYQIPINNTFAFLNYSSLFRVRVRYSSEVDALNAMEIVKKRNMTANIAILDSWFVEAMNLVINGAGTTSGPSGGNGGSRSGGARVSLRWSGYGHGGMMFVFWSVLLCHWGVF